MTFDEWANKQFGKEPHPGKSLLELWQEVDNLNRLLRLTEQRVRDRENWRDKRNAAMYAWNIKDKDKHK